MNTDHGRQRTGLELDIEQPDQLITYLRQTGRIEAAEEPSVRLLTGGVSNRTMLVERKTGTAWVLKQALAKLRVAVDWHSDPRRVEREALGIRYLSQLVPSGSVPGLVFEDPAHHLLAMEAAPTPHENWKTLLLNNPPIATHIAQFGRLLGAIHRNAFHRSAELAPLFNERSFFESLRLEPYYQHSANQRPEAADFLHWLIAETLATRLTLVHGDYSPKNILVHDDRLILLDHEVIHWGDPAFDVGFSMAHLLSKAHHLPERRSAFAFAAVEYWQSYIDSLDDMPWKPTLEARAVRHSMACLLARSVGRSPLEYLDDTQRNRQADSVIQLTHSKPPTTVASLIESFLAQIEEKERHGGH